MLFLSARLMRLSSVMVAGVVAMGVAPAVADPLTAEPWLSGAFSADAGAMARSAAALDADGDVVMLFRDDSLSFDQAGRMTHRRRWVYRIQTPEGLEGWSLSEAAWSPWHQQRPAIRARVIDAGGVEIWLDPEKLSELTAEEAGLSGERRLVRAALPVNVGAVVEEEVVIRGVQPLFAAGACAKHLLVMPVPIHRGRLVLEAPTSLPLRFGVRRMKELAPRREIAAGRVRLTFDYAGMRAAQTAEAGLPADEPRYPHVAFSAGESWSRVAHTFARSVDAAIAGSEPEAVLKWLPRVGVETQLERIAELLQGIRGNVRYRPAELGSAPMTPARPLAILRRGSGDGKDLAVLLTAALRAEGIPAYVALVRAGYGMDVEPELPGLGRFNHVFVYVPAGEPVWIDPGDRYSRAGELASDRQGRLALVASPNTRQLVRTPVAASGANRTVTTIEVFMAEEGPARVVETSIHFGAAERRQRLVSAQVDRDDRRRGYQAYLETTYRAEALGEVEESGLADLSVPFRLRLEALRAGRAWTRGNEAALAIDLSNLITALPRELLVASERPRRGDFVFHEPFVSEWRYRVEPPPGMTLRALPEDFVRPLGAGRLTRTVHLEGSVVHADFRLDSGPRRLTSEQFLVYRANVQDLLQEQALVLSFARESPR